jgi:uncharacterized cupredoxin-like copper-binding protein
MIVARMTLTAPLMLIVAFALAGCGQGSEVETDVSISLTEFAFGPDEIVLLAGDQVTLTLANEGSVRHEFMVGRNPMANSAGYIDDFFEGIEPTVTPSDAVAEDMHDDHAGFMVILDPGHTAEVSFVVPDDRTGEWEVGCFEPGHYDAGMHAVLTVE